MTDGDGVVRFSAQHRASIHSASGSLRKTITPVINGMEIRLTPPNGEMLSYPVFLGEHPSFTNPDPGDIAIHYRIDMAKPRETALELVK